MFVLEWKLIILGLILRMEINFISVILGCFKSIIFNNCKLSHYNITRFSLEKTHFIIKFCSRKI